MAERKANIPDFRLSLDNRDLRGAIFEAVTKFIDLTPTIRPRLISLNITETESRLHPGPFQFRRLQFCRLHIILGQRQSQRQQRFQIRALSG